VQTNDDDSWFACTEMSDDGEEEAEEELGPNLGVSCATVWYTRMWC